MSRERVTIPYSSAGHGSLSHVSSIMVVGHGCVGMSYVGFLGQIGWRERESGKKNISKIFFSPVSAFAGKKNMHSAI